MPVVLVVIVVMAWAVILGPSLLKRRSSGGAGISSISHFHHQLRVLEHSAPTPIVTPAYRLHGVDDRRDPRGGSGPQVVAAAPVLTVVGAKELPRPALAFLGQDPAGQPADRAPDRGADRAPDRGADRAPGLQRTTRDPDVPDEEWLPWSDRLVPELPSRGPDPYARRLARRRRRDTLGVMTVVLVMSLMAGFIPGASFLWVVTGLSAVALAAYVGQLVHLRRMAEERERKLHYLRPRTAEGAEPGRPAGPPTYMSGRYAHPSNGAAAVR